MKAAKGKNKKAARPKAKKASKPAKKKVVAKKKTAKKATKVKATKKKKSAPVSAKKKAVKKTVAKKPVVKAKVKAKAKPATAKKKLPGYPHYSAKEDIMNPANKAIKVELTEEKNIKPAAKKREREELQEKPWVSDINTTAKARKEDNDLFSDNEELSSDMGDDEVLKDRAWPVDMSGADLDVPGAELDDDAEATGNEDEENNNYSLGGDRHEDLDENTD